MVNEAATPWTQARARRRIERLALTCLVIVTLGPGLPGCRASGQEPARAEQQKRVSERMTEVQKLLPAWVQAGGNVQEMAALGQKVGEYVNAGDFVRAEDTAD